MVKKYFICAMLSNCEMPKGEYFTPPVSTYVLYADSMKEAIKEYYSKTQGWQIISISLLDDDVFLEDLSLKS